LRKNKKWRVVMSIDPVHELEGKWYFYNETLSDRMGPFDSEEVAREAFGKYCKECLGDEK